MTPESLIPSNSALATAIVGVVASPRARCACLASKPVLGRIAAARLGVPGVRPLLER